MSGQRDAREDLASECRIFTRYLIDLDPTAYIVEKYVAAHEVLDVLRPSTRFDRLLVRLARGSAVFRWPAASFARVHAPHSALQNKLVTLLAILETAPVTGRTIDSVPSASVPWLLFGLGLRGVLAAASLVAGTALLLPLRWMSSERRAAP